MVILKDRRYYFADKRTWRVYGSREAEVIIATNLTIVEAAMDLESSKLSAIFSLRTHGWQSPLIKRLIEITTSFAWSACRSKAKAEATGTLTCYD